MTDPLHHIGPRALWTPERIALVTKLWAEGFTASQCAKLIGGITRNAVIGKVNRLGLQKRSPGALKATRSYKAPRPPRPKAEKTFVAPQPPRVTIPARAWDPLPGSAPRPWEDRGKGCAWPIGEGLSCCEPTGDKATYCATHRVVMFVPARTPRSATRRVFHNTGSKKQRAA